MKRTVLTIITLLTVIAATAATEIKQLALKNIASGTDISGEYIDLSTNTMLVDQCHGGEILLLYQQKSAEAMLYSSIEQGFRWKKDNMGGLFLATRMGLLNTNNTDQVVNGNTGFFTTLDDLMGKHVWTRNFYPVYFNDSANIVIGYKAKFNSFDGDIEFHNKNVAYCYRLTDGKELWQDTITHYTRWGWNDVKYMPETGKFLLWADELMLIDPQKGIQRRLTLNTGKYGVPIGVSKKDRRTDHGTDADYAFTPYVDRGYYTGIKSNMIFKNDKIYLADAEEIYCLNMDLEPLWINQLPKKQSSAMILRIDGNTITLLSKGYAYLEGVAYNVGKPFVALVDAANGTMYSLKNINVEGKIIDSHLANGKAFYLTSDGLNEVENFRDPLVKVYDKQVTGKVKNISNHTLYALDGNHMTLMESNDDQLVIIDKDDNYSLFNIGSGKVEKSVAGNKLFDKRDNVYTCMSRNKKGELTDDPDDLIIVDGNGEVKTHISMPFTGAFYTDGLLTLVMNTGIFSSRL